MWLTWLMIAIAIAMVVGPVMMLRPTPGVAKLAKIRECASKAGMSVQLIASAKANTGAVYTLPHKAKKSSAADNCQWTLSKQKFVHELHFHDLWDWEGPKCPDERQYTPLKTLLQKTPEGIRGFSCNPAGVSCEWDELCRGKSEQEAVDDIKDLLGELRSVIH